MLTVKCINELAEKGRDGRVYEFKYGEQYRLTLAGCYVLEIERTQVVIKKRSKFYKHFIII